MKKIVYLITIITCFGLISCENKKNYTKEEEAFNEFKKRSELSYKICENYLEDYYSKNMGEIEKVYSDKLKKRINKDIDSKFDVVAYKIIDSDNNIEKSNYKVSVIRSIKNVPETQLENKIITVENEKITNIDNSLEREILPDGEKLRLKQGTNIGLDLIISPLGLPTYIYQSDNVNGIEKTEITSKNIGTIAFSFDGEKLALTTKGPMCMIGFTSINANKAKGNNSDPFQSLENIGNGGFEKPLGKNINVFDVIEADGIDKIIFNGMESHILVQYKSDKNTDRVSIYNIDTNEPFKEDINGKFSKEDYDVTIGSFNGGDVMLKVKVINKNADKSLEGDYKINFREDEKIEKI